ncbi:EAL and HDOD domain-containing protein [Aeromonas veronii]|uniref:EAL and HDOD domain-containing protein n=1 Tax=Aeromonas veronii TaxID=654 RepID=UPI0015D615D2|nr:HDOD domain-containing protein [Aeromonas veronii]
MNCFIARQPIFDERKCLYAYELLYRDSELNEYPAAVNNDSATSRILEEQILFGDIDSLLSFDGRCFINFDACSILKGYVEILPKKKVVIELLESIEPTIELFDKIECLYNDGYIFALDDVDEHVIEQWQEIIHLIAIIKVDVKMASALFCKEITRSLVGEHLFLAEKIESMDEYVKYKSLGYDLFQGYFFCKPELLSKKTVKSNYYNALDLFNELMQPHFNVTRVESILLKDPSLSIKFLRYVNIIAKARKDVTSIRHAISFSGRSEMIRFISIIMANSFSEGVSKEVVFISLTRAKFGELFFLNKDFESSQKAFLVGLLSVFDVLMGENISELLEGINVPQDIKSSIVDHAGDFGNFLAAVKLYEQGEFGSFICLALSISSELPEVTNMYYEALKWARSVIC